MSILKIVLVSSLVFAGVVSAKSELNVTQLRAAAYLLKQLEKQPENSTLKVQSSANLEHDNCQTPPPYQPPQPDTQCITYVAGSYPSADERVRAARACAGVYSLECVQYAAGSYPSFAERESAARSCSGVHDIACAQYVAGSYPSTSERTQAVEACRYASVDCVRQVAGSYPSFAERIAAAKACSGN